MFIDESREIVECCTLSRLPTSLAYSSRTSCSSGLSSGSFSGAYRLESIDESMIAV